jgi:precorrin-6B methylase 2
MAFKFLSALRYYVSSIPTLLKGLDFWRVPLLLLGKPVRLTTRSGLRFYVASLMDVWLMKEVVLDLQYEMVRPVKEGDTVLDIGASIGDFSVMAGRKAARVFAYEMDTRRARLASRNIRLNGAANVRLYNQEARSLDAIFEENGIERCDFLKVDCEGCEYPVLLGASDAALSKVGHIAMEIHLQTPERKRHYAELLRRLAGSGFIVREVDSPVHSYLKLTYASRQADA